ncbi:MAG: AAA family ATPase [Minicystis sp.]
MSDPQPASWSEANQRYLTASIAILRERLRLRGARGEGPPAEERASVEALERARDELRASLPFSPALDRLGALFALSPFESDLLLLSAGVEIDTALASSCALAQGDPRAVRPTLGLALEALPGAHWTALAPDGPLRHFRLVDLAAGPTLTTSPIVVGERVLHYLLGIDVLEDCLRALVDIEFPPTTLPPSHRALATRVADLWTAARAPASAPAILLSGDDRAGKRAVAASAADALGMRLFVLHAADLPATPADRDELLRTWEREALLLPGALLLDCEDVEGHAAWRALASFADRSRCPLLISARAAIGLERRDLARVDVDKLAAEEQRLLWREALGDTTGALDGALDAVLSSFDLSARTIHEASREVAALAERPEDMAARLWEACRVRARPKLDDLAQRIEAAAGWDDLVLPAEQRDILRATAAQVRQRRRVYDGWGFGVRGARGLGISALFAGPSGTGKTMAAEILARELSLDLYRVDLSQVVSKYIGETEKNLRRVFDAADEGGAILLFDEADALFGKRSEVKDSHDRFANIEVGYLLQRMEAYRGLAILTTNLKSSLDQAFLRRIRFVVSFPFPDAANRAEIWRRAFPRATPTEGLDLRRLSRLTVTGGTIRNIVLNAAFLAADAGEPVQMKHIGKAAKAECVKLEKPALESEIAGWV